MTTPSDMAAAEVFAIIEEPTAQVGRIRTFLLKVMAPFSGQVIPRGTHLWSSRRPQATASWDPQRLRRS